VRRGWWRRNWWGLLALLPVLALAVGADAKDLRDRLREDPIDPTVPIVTPLGTWVGYGGGDLRMVALQEVTGLTGYGGEPFPLPAGVRAWRATLEFRDPAEKLGGCQVFLLDRADRRFEPDPAELRGAKKSFGSCSPEFDAAPAPTFRREFYFVLPSGARPAAVGLALATEHPDYVRLVAPG
jgi:hypothetical protein